MDLAAILTVMHRGWVIVPLDLVWSFTQIIIAACLLSNNPNVRMIYLATKKSRGTITHLHMLQQDGSYIRFSLQISLDKVHNILLNSTFVTRHGKTRHVWAGGKFEFLTHYWNMGFVHFNDACCTETDIHNNTDENYVFRWNFSLLLSYHVLNKIYIINT